MVMTHACRRRAAACGSDGVAMVRTRKHGAAAVLALARGQTHNTAIVYSKYQEQRFYHRYLPLPGRQDRG
jgi:hypothetical protein